MRRSSLTSPVHLSDVKFKCRMEDKVFMNWTVIVLTCQHKDSVYAFQRGEFIIFYIHVQMY